MLDLPNAGTVPEMDISEARDFWLGQIPRNFSPTSLAQDNKKSASDKPASATSVIEIHAECRKLLAEKTNDSPFLKYTILMAALNICLYRYTRLDKIVVGSPARIQEDTGQNISNALPIINAIDPDLTIKEFLKAVRNSLIEAYKYQYFDYEDIIAGANPGEVADKFELFDISLAFDGVHTALPSVNSSINFVFSDSEGGLKGTVEFKSKFYDRKTIEHFTRHFINGLTDALGNLDKKIASVEIMSDAERERQINEWSGRNNVIELRRLTAPVLFERQVDAFPDAIAAVDVDNEITYAELDRKANRLARYLINGGIRTESRVGIMLERGIEMLTAVLAVFKCGGIYVPLDPAYPPDRLAYMIEDSAPELILTQTDLEEKLPRTAAAIIKPSDDQESIERESSERLTDKATADNGAYMIYTSGSTGKPKGVVVTHSGLEALAREQGRQFGVRQGSRVLQFASLSFDASVAEIVVTLANGGTLCLAEQETLRSGLQLMRLIEELRVEIATLPPALLSVLEPPENGSLKTVIAAGEACYRKTVENWGAGRKFLNAYGPSEATVCATIWENKGEILGENMPIGKPIPNTRVYILDERMNAVPVGAAGELYLGGGGLARGYWGKARLTAERFVPDPFGAAGERLYKTGDVGRFLSNGEIEYLGRADRQIKIRGYRVELGEIEAQTRLCPAVSDAVVEAVGNEENDNRNLICYFVRSENSAENPADQLRHSLVKKLPEYMIPSRFVELEKIPLTRNGKVDHNKLAEFSVVNIEEKKGAIAAVENPAVGLLAGIWEEILDTQVTALNSNFFELGGHSLLATQLISRVRETFGIELELGTVFDNPQFEQLAGRIVEQTAGKKTSMPPLETFEKDSPLPLSFAQQRMWFLNQFEGESGNYNISFPLKIKGGINIAALERSIETITARHEILRTVFEVDEAGKPVQKIKPPIPFRLNVINLTNLPKAEAEAEAVRLVDEQARRKFDFSGGGTFDIKLIELPENESVLTVTMHHIISDGWSNGVFVRELASAYRAFLDDAVPELSPLPVQYADYAAWQRKYLSDERLDEQLEFWKQRLGFAGEPLELPLDFARPRVRTFNGAKRRLDIKGDLVGQLTQLSRSENATLFMTLLAAFNILLARISGQNDISVGTPTANRNLKELESLIGFFVNTLVIRTDVSGAETFAGYLKRVREATLKAYAHQDIPFEKLVEELRPERDLSRTPLFQVMFVMQNVPQEKLELAGIELSGFRLEQKTAKFDLTLTVDQAEDGLIFGLEYNTDLFKSETIVHLLDCLHRLLLSITANPEEKIWNLDVLPDEEREKILNEWSGRSYVTKTSQMTAPVLFERQVDSSPDIIAAVSIDSQISYAELDARANRLARLLKRKNIDAEKRVGIMLERGIEMLTAVLAVFKCGGIYVPLDPAYPPDRLAYMIEDSAPELILTETSLEERLPWTAAEIVRLNEIDEELAASLNERLNEKIEPDNGAYMIYTSGSTGKPKGVVVTHSGLEALAREQGRQFGVRQGSRVLQFASLSFDASVFDISMALFNGGTLYLPDRETILPGIKLNRYLEENEISVITVTPTALAALPFADLPALETINVAGEACPAELAARWSAGRDFFNLYGPTESTVWATSFKYDEAAERISIGKPISNTRVYVLDERMNAVPVGAAGELYLGGEALARGYWQSVRLTAERFVPDPFGAVGERLYRTGDVGRFLSNGEIEYLGRADRQIKIRGYRVELGEIETVLHKMKEVREAAADVRTDERGNAWLTAYVVPNEGEEFNAARMKELLQEELPNYMLPARFVELEAMPVLPSGKIDRKNLPDAGDSQIDSGVEFQAPSTETEEMIAEIWREALNLKKVGIEDNFFTLGGHSLLLAQVHSKLVQEFDKEISLVDLFKYPTIKSLASYLTEEAAADSGRARERAETRMSLRDKQAALRKRARETGS